MRYIFLYSLYLFYSILYFNICYSADFKNFDDSIQYKLNWPGKVDVPLDDDKVVVGAQEMDGYIVVKSLAKEKYNCTLPVLKKKIKVQDDSYDGPNAIELLKPLFQSPSCYSRIEQFWTYEICHGRHIRQYHEEKDGKKIKLQEYYLGTWPKHMTSEISKELDKLSQERKSPPVKKVDGSNVPYLELNYTDGTFCELVNEPRQISVHYMCLKNIKSDVLAVNELSTCFYQVNVFTQHLCKHPKYRAEEMENNEIYCYPLEGASDKPKSLMQLEAQSEKRRNFKPPPGKNEKVVAVYSIDEIGEKDGKVKLRVEFHTIDSSDELESKGKRDNIGVSGSSSSAAGISPIKAPQPPPNMPIPLSIQDFLLGKNCLRGGSGWWKYKFCYGKSVEQFHIENLPDGSVDRTSILLGIFDKQAHLDWIQANPHKKPKPLSERTSFSQYYTHGEVCDKTKKERRTEVKLKCVEKAGTVTLYLLEPKVCNYILGVESPLICELLHRVDDNGLIDYKKDLLPTLADALLNP